MAKVNCTFKTDKQLKQNLSEMAGFVKKHRYKIGDHWQDPVKECTTRSALIHNVVAGKISISEIEQKIKEVRENDREK